MIKVITDPAEKRAIASHVLHDLPEWFGLPDSTVSYVRESADLPFLAYLEGGQAVGFAALKGTSPHAADIFVMGIRRAHHRKGIGKALHTSLERTARELGYRYLQVKTLAMGHDPGYDCTNRFWQAMGFVELECFPTLWDERNPCQIYVKYIGDSTCAHPGITR